MSDKKINPNNQATGQGIYGLPYLEKESKVVYLSIPWEATTSYGQGTSLGPLAIFKASFQMDLFDLDFLDPYAVGLFMRPSPIKIKNWNKKAKQEAQKIIKNQDKKKNKSLLQSLTTVNELSDKLNQWVYEESCKIIKNNQIPIVVGGDHSTPFGAIRAYGQKYSNLGVLHFDAHSDTRQAYMGFLHSHASIMRNVLENIPSISKLVQVGIRDFCEEEFHYTQNNPQRCKVYFDQSLQRRKQGGESFLQIAQEIAASLPQEVYISIDIDGLDPKYCPHTGTPVPGGLDYQELITIVYAVYKSGRTIVGFDLVEVAPSQDKMKNEWDANVGMRLLYKLTAFTLASQQLIKAQ